MKYLLMSTLALALAPLAHAGTIHVTFSEDFAEDLADDYGAREGEYLTKNLTSDIERAFGSDLEGLGDITIHVESAKPNRPTFKQLGDTPGLSMQSLSIGGAKLSGEVKSTTGETLAQVDYKYFENDIRQVVGKSTWSDANRAFDRFARKLAKETAIEG